MLVLWKNRKTMSLCFSWLCLCSERCLESDLLIIQVQASCDVSHIPKPIWLMVMWYWYNGWHPLILILNYYIHLLILLVLSLYGFTRCDGKNVHYCGQISRYSFIHTRKLFWNFSWVKRNCSCMYHNLVSLHRVLYNREISLSLDWESSVWTIILLYTNPKMFSVTFMTGIFGIQLVLCSLALSYFYISQWEWTDW